jgi:hypothetical protein
MQPLAPRDRFVGRPGRHPHRDAEDVVGASLLRDVEQGVADAPAAADAEGDAVAVQVDLGRVSVCFRIRQRDETRMLVGA